MDSPSPCSTWNLRTDVWPGSPASARMSPTEEGLLVELLAGQLLRSAPLCEGSAGRIRMVFRTLSEDARLGVELRRVRGQDSLGGLAVELEPMLQRIRLVRWLDLERERIVQPIVAWQTVPGLPPAGSWTSLLVDLHAQQLRVEVEGRPVLQHALVQCWSGEHGVRVGGHRVADGTVELSALHAWNIVEQASSTLANFRVGRMQLHLPTGAVSRGSARQGTDGTPSAG